jgi:hypothetical protein
MKNMNPAIVQNRPEVEREFDVFAPKLMAGLTAASANCPKGWRRFIPATSAPMNCAR